MATLQNEFVQFNEEIKLGAYDENKDLRDKRDASKQIMRIECSKLTHIPVTFELIALVDHMFGDLKKSMKLS